MVIPLALQELGGKCYIIMCLYRSRICDGTQSLKKVEGYRLDAVVISICYVRFQLDKEQER